ncbi:DNA glycosylase [Dichotomocladium elegans]|nr:DNA glycosylase [Dichotomocladium elegans]
MLKRFHASGRFIKETAAILNEKYDGDIPGTIEGLTSLPGVGPKMGYLALQVAWNINAGIGVDVHVHRIANRLGWVHTEDGLPEDTRKALESWLPREYWRPVNPMLVGFGQILCLPRGPRCGECPVRDLCPSAVITTEKVKKEIKIEKKGFAVVKEEAFEDTNIKVKSEPEIKTEESLDW